MILSLGNKFTKKFARSRAFMASYSTNFNHSYWEVKEYFRPFDLIVIGSGIVGLSTAISFREKNKKSSVLILEKGILPDGASTKNAGFACFGSPGELLDDLSKMPEDTVWETVAMRWNGLNILRKRLGDKKLGYENNGGFELFLEKEKLEHCTGKLDWLNKRIRETISLKKCYVNDSSEAKRFKGVKGALLNRFEGQLDTAAMMARLLDMATGMGIRILNNIRVVSMTEQHHKVSLHTAFGVFKASKVVVATNGYASQLLNIDDVKPARAQVLVTEPVKDLNVRGTYHFDDGYYYFRNIDGRILFGGGRNLDIKGETTAEQGLRSSIQQRLDHYLRTMIVPTGKIKVESRWSGIMGVGKEKKPIIRMAGRNILAAVRMGGMGIAIGSWVGKKAAAEIS